MTTTKEQQSAYIYPTSINLTGYEEAMCIISCKSNADFDQEATVYLGASDTVDPNGKPAIVAIYRDGPKGSNENKVMEYIDDKTKIKHKTYTSRVKLPLTFFVSCCSYFKGYPAGPTAWSTSYLQLDSNVPGEMSYTLKAEDGYDTDRNDVVMSIRFIGLEPT